MRFETKIRNPARLVSLSLRCVTLGIILAAGVVLLHA
jgi:hypothetical protein